MSWDWGWFINWSLMMCSIISPILFSIIGAIVIWYELIPWWNGLIVVLGGFVIGLLFIWQWEWYSTEGSGPVE